MEKVFALALDGSGGSTLLSPGSFQSDPDADGFTWHHLSRDAPESKMLLAKFGLDSFVIEALTADETRPRCTVHGAGVLLNLRGVNLSPGAEPEDMISIRLWLDERNVVSVWSRPLYAVSDLLAAIDRNEGPVSSGDFVAKLALRLADRAEPSVATLNEEIDEMEEELLVPHGQVSRPKLSEIRRRAIILRRYMIPQRDAISTLEIEDLSWLRERDRGRLREAAERVFRLGEELDAIRERAQIIHDQVMDQRSERMNAQMLLLSVVAAIFLPLGLLTGLLGMNVGGIPWANNPWGFAIACVLLVAVGGGLFWWVKKAGMLE
ncbi:MAG: CorA family divalent cation transporter [Marinosulfonomonas sp.]